MKKEAADQKRKAEEEKIRASMEQAKRQEDEKNLQRYVDGQLLFIHSTLNFAHTWKILIVYC